MNEVINSGILKKEDHRWYVQNNDFSNLPLLSEDAVFCLESDKGSVVEFSLVKDEFGNEFARFEQTETEGLSWEDIENQYSSDNYQFFEGKRMNTINPFKWFKLHFNPPTKR